MTASIQQRGETAVLGLGARSSPLAQLPVHDYSSFASSRLQAPMGESSINVQEARLAARGIARRKLRRRENARLSSNPHVVRPSPSDYALQHPNGHKSSFPLPAHLQNLRLPSRPVSTRTSSSDDASSSAAGRFTMTYADAHYFLAHRVGIRPGQESLEEQPGVLQAFTKRAEAELQAWLHQDIFLAPDAQLAVPDALVDLNSHDDQRDLRIIQVSKNPHNLVWEIPDAFLRLAVHCLARVLHCPTFSKDGANGRQTWILNPKPGKGYSGTASMSHSMLDTPPPTDVGTDVASEMASEIDSDWAMSEMGDGDDTFDTLIVEHSEAIEDDEDIVVVPYIIEEEDDNLADIEDA
ncbi:hypothetical protein CBS101457_002886 [Exobasidium rhododendri]|nr:hypothetical protein CBS101457_002886 [Exobasidium rhododendri]